MEQSDIILLLDKKFSVNPVTCPNEGVPTKIGGNITSVHGNLTVHKSGAFLVCGPCGHNEPVGRT